MNSAVDKLKRTKVIAISGASGAGKTTVTRSVAELLDCPYILFDEYVAADTYPANMKSWLDKGGCFDEIRTPGLAQAIKKTLIENRHPFLFVEEPFGYERATIRPLTDHVILLKTPLELCLSRLIRRHLNHPLNDKATVLNYLEKYENHLREIYQFTINKVEVNCDVVINGVGSSEAISQNILDWLGLKGILSGNNLLIE